MGLLPTWNGELLIEFAGKQETLRPTFTGLRKTETALGGSVFVAASEFERGIPRVTTIATVIACCLNDGGSKNPGTGYAWSIDDVGALILSDAMVGWAEIAAALITHWITAGREGRAALGEASAAVRRGILKRIDGQPVSASSPTTLALPLPASESPLPTSG
jgi:hypothetical protein